MPDFPHIPQTIELTPEYWWDNPPQTIEEATELLLKKAVLIKSPSIEGQQLRKLLAWVDEKYKLLQEEVKNQHPLAFFKPSYEQSLLLNAWWTGTSFPICFSANRIGKTACFVINALLWIFPNDPTWLLFKPYTDHLGRRVHILPRPPITHLNKINQYLALHPELQGDPNFSYDDSQSGNQQRFATLQTVTLSGKINKYYKENDKRKSESDAQLLSGCYPLPPIQSGETIWLGAPDRDFHKNIILREWKRWLPQHSIKWWSESELSFHISTVAENNPKATTIEVVCKSYESKDTKWSGAAVSGIVLTEGLEPDVLDEIKQRVKENAFASWDYTPYEARNVGKKTALAFRVMQGKEELPLRPHVFTNFSARNAPDHILPKSKRDDLIRMWKDKPEGAARLDGAFFSDSPLILSNLNREKHCLEIDFATLQNLYPTAKLYRGLDPGYDHPTCCAWAALLPSNIWVVYRFYSRRGRTIPQRCRDIIKMSNNQRQKVTYGQRKDQFRYKEVHMTPFSEVYNATFMDFHAFAADQVTGTSNSLNYISEGLAVSESVHTNPQDRAQDCNKLLDTYTYLTHPITKEPGASKLYFLINEPGVAAALEKMESLFWERYASGPNKGSPKDTVQAENDDELDALCYLTSSPLKWHPYRPPEQICSPEQVEPFQKDDGSA